MDDMVSADNVRRHLLLAQKRGAELWQDDRLTWLRRQSEPPSWFSGPTEEIFAIWWHHLTAAMNLDFGDFATLHSRVQVPVNGSQYLVDFEVALADPFLNYLAQLKQIAMPRIAVTLDGEGGDAQAAASGRERSSALEAAGWKVFQFSESEVNLCPEACVREVMDASKPILEGLHRQLLREAFEAIRPKPPGADGS